MKIINILFCLFLLILNSCTANDPHTQETKSRGKRDLSQKEAPQEKSKSKEELLKEKLSDDQKTQLDWLKIVLTDAGEFGKFLENNEDKIKSALDHIKTELNKCTGNDEGKNIFKAVVKEFFTGEEDIDKFKDQVISACGG
ncbi:Mlp family lipoprotein (plasmid) [Borrelia sp. CA_690]|uniref:Mlp family lipoprotein n=1 Tax=Borrelia maritima TaxID=2761123 RepID=A0A5J6WG16_9SPIR|nr:Mlp family lipoprotein [Borrelia maritima]QFI15089.1 Mlp family lipoprotein [Borrelia maritima]